MNHAEHNPTMSELPFGPAEVAPQPAATATGTTAIAREPRRRRLVCGVDEAGRGPLAGPVVAAAVVLNARRPIEGVRDSKLLTALARERLADAIRARSIAWAIGVATVDEIERLNILQASLLAMQRAVQALQPAADRALVDGKHLPAIGIPARAIVDGDALEPAISAASILAKTHRDALMRQVDAQFPGYGFAEHVGYATPEHLQRLRELGPCAAHRRSFAPVRALMMGSLF